MVNKREIFIFFLLLLLGVFALYVYSSIKTTKGEIYEQIERYQIERISGILRNIENDFVSSLGIKDSSDLISAFEDDKNRHRYEDIISLVMTSDIKYAYILYKDKKDKFRFILDASKTDKANFYQKFDTDSQKYLDVYKTKKPQVVRQKKIENLYITYLYPIIKKDEVIAVFNIDITTSIQKNILNLLKPIEMFFVVLIVLIIFLILMTALQFFHYFFTTKKIFKDSLTQIYNRHYLDKILPSLDRSKYSLAMLDIDKFKPINDTYGHKAGDHILFCVSEVFQNSIRDKDILVRYGGEEFLLLMYDTSSSLEICERLRENIKKETFRYEAHEIKLSVSIGLIEDLTIFEDIYESVKIADKMLYKAKRSGRDKVVKQT